MDVLSDRKKILFVIPSASINGAIVVLMHFLEWLKVKHPEIKLEILVQWGSNNSQDTFYRSKLEQFGEVTFLEELNADEKQNLKKRYLKEHFNCVFYNSIISVDTQKFLEDLHVTKLFFVHELERLMTLFRVQEHAYLYKHNCKFIACSQSVKNAIIKVLDVNEFLIKTVYEFIDTAKIEAELAVNSDESSDTLNPRQETSSITSSSFTVGFSGTFELRKSADLLPSLAIEIKKRVKDAKLVWVGASTFNGEPGTFDMVYNDLALAELSDVKLIPKDLGQFKYYRDFDVFVMASREDAFPVVNLEMGALGIPIICFDKSGGSVEYAKMGGGVSVPFMDLGAVADQVQMFYENRGSLENYKKSAPVLITNNFGVDIQAPKLFEIIKSCF